MPLKLTGSIRAGAPLLGSFALALGGSLLAFFLTISLCTFSGYFHANVVALLCVVAALAFAGLVWTRHLGAWRLPLGCCGILAIFFGALLGDYCYGEYGYYALLYANSRTYHDVDPLQGGGSVADAGRLVFSAEARVDTSNSVGYVAEDGVMYCVAPIRGFAAPARVDFWAAGTDCCATKGGFRCDSAADSTARGGIVIFPNRPSGGGLPGALLGLSGVPREVVQKRYAVARRKAEAAMGLTRAQDGEAVFVRWVAVARLKMLSRYYQEQAWVFIGVALYVYACVSTPIAWLTSRASAASFFPSGLGLP